MYDVAPYVKILLSDENIFAEAVLSAEIGNKNPNFISINFPEIQTLYLRSLFSVLFSNRCCDDGLC